MQRNLMSVLAEKGEEGEEVALITMLSGDETVNCRIGTMMLVDRSGEVLAGGMGGGFLEDKARKEAMTCLERGLSRKVTLAMGEGAVELFVNVLSRCSRLIIAGAGNVALHIYRLATVLGYNITIVDNRAEYLNRDRFPQADELILGDIPERLSSIDITEDTYVVIATHHHQFDEPALRAVISSGAKYIGMIGNVRKVTACLDRLRASGVPDELVEKVHAPIGLDLGGRKTSEIALSVLAEMQAVRYGRSGGFLQKKEGNK